MDHHFVSRWSIYSHDAFRYIYLPFIPIQVQGVCLRFGMRRVYHPIYPRDNPKMYSNLTTDYRWINYSFKEKFPHYSSFYTNLGWYPSDFNLILFKAHVVFQGTNSGNFSTGGSEEQSVYFGQITCTRLKQQCSHQWGAAPPSQGRGSSRLALK